MSFKVNYDNSPIKAGDIVQFHLKDYRGSFTHLGLYTVKGLKYGGSTVMVTRDDNRSETNGYNVENFKKVKVEKPINVKKGDKVFYYANNYDNDFSGRLGQVYTIGNIDGDYKNEFKTEEANYIRRDNIVVISQILVMDLREIYYED